MQLADVNVFVHAFRADAPNHARYHAWLHALVNGEAAFAVSELVLSGFLRVVTHARVFDPPTPLPRALEFARSVLAVPRAVRVQPTARHWGIFERLCAETGARGKHIPDAYLAALAIDTGCEWISADRDFARYRGLRWHHPLD